MNNKPDDIDRWYDLIARELAEDLSAEELAALNSWVQASPENRKLYEESTKLWNMAEDDVVFFDTEKALANVQEKNQRNDEQKNNNSSGFSWKWIAAAASLILIVSLIFTLNNKDVQMVSYQTTDSAALFTLPDSSKVWLKENSSIEFLSDFADNRTITLKGKAYFEVESDPNRPFRVDGGKALVTVLGTGFLVESSDSVTLVQVDHGKVQVNDKKDGDKKVVLTKGEQVRVVKDSMNKTLVVDKNYLSWQKQELSFDDRTLAEVLPELEQYFHVSIHSESEELLKCKFTANLQKPVLHETLTIITLSTGAEFREEKGEYILSGKGCSSK